MANVKKKRGLFISNYQEVYFITTDRLNGLGVGMDTRITENHPP